MNVTEEQENDSYIVYTVCL